MIISASRRTDIPAFYAEWFMNRIRAGWCEVVNPVNRSIVSYVSLAPANVEVIAFWSKNPRPLMPFLDELDALGYRYYFLFTLNDYPREIEPGVPPRDERVQTIRELASRIGPHKVVWRYDPIIVSRRLDLDFHLRTFAALADSLRGATQRTIVSVVDFYQKTRRRLAAIEEATGDAFNRDPFGWSGFEELARTMAEIAQRNGMDVQSCAEDPGLQSMGIRQGKCIDPELIRRVFGIEVSSRKDPSQRAACGCSVSRDIGAPDSCLHGCEYCYATRSLDAARRRYAAHDPSAPAM